MEKYKKSIETINNLITDFNKVIAVDCHVELIDITNINDSNYFLNIIDVYWDDILRIGFPRCGTSGVYFYFGFNKNDKQKLCTYIGKASFDSTVGNRLYAHFQNRGSAILDGKDYYMNGEYALELITTIPIENAFIAPALEEYLIYHLPKKGHELFNKVGNR